MTLEGRRLRIRGIVQGVGFRPWVYRLARQAGVAGRVRNDGDGVLVDIFGPADTLDHFASLLRHAPPPAASIASVTADPIPYEPLETFAIVPSARDAAPRVSIPPDLATCPDCLRELGDPRDRRHRYAFTNCTNCGPRYTITRSVPYDRAATTMAAFEMCDACRREYETPADRRFHAEPNACPACGPSPRLHAANGVEVPTRDPITAAALAIEAGLIVAVKGLGGFHLACDATSSHAVATLRERKRRDEKPLAVMVPDLAAADALALLSDEERATLAGPVRPIVLARRRDRTPLAPDVAPGNPLVGLMLPYTPLHHLLLAEVARPLVMTSGNLSEEPLAYRTHDAVARLRDIADLFLTHDRVIEAPADDSIVRQIGKGLTVLRRSRGYVPRAVSLKTPIDRPVLACGALLKNTFCLARGDQAWLGPHIGDLDHVATQQFFESSIARFERFLQCSPEVVVHDLHPGYPSTAYALARAGVATVGVQHHHAHVASAMAEHGLDGPVLGLAWDGTGYGTDGAAWGGELLLATRRAFERLATFRPVPLAGGDVAIRQVWRIALALVLDACGPDAPLRALPLFQRVPDRDLTVVRQLVEARVNTPLAHGVGRYFDGFGALGLARRESRFEGQVAALWDHVADPAPALPLPWTLDRSVSPWIVDLRPAVREGVELVLARRAAGGIAARFHQTLIDVGLALVRATLAIRGPLPVVLTGGCFQNARLAEGLAEALAPHATVHLHRDVPPGDGGLALGQVLVAG